MKRLIVKNAEGSGNKSVVINASFHADLPETAEAGKPFVIQVAPAGEYPQFIDDPNKPGEQKRIVQIVDDQAIKSMVDHFHDKVLVDADHSSELSTNTKAYAWVTKLFIDPEKGLMAEIDPTPLGVEAINGKIYRFVSGAWSLDDDNRPIKLVSIGLTNKPNLPVAPMINAQAGKGNEAGTGANAGTGVTPKNPDAKPAGEGDQGAAGAGAGPTGSQNDNANPKPDDSGAGAGEHPKGEIQMNLKQKLGLPEEATDAEVEAAIDALLTKSQGMDAVANTLGLEPTATNEDVQEALNAVIENCGTLQAQNAEAEQAKLNAEAEQLVADNADVIPEEQVDEVKAAYVEDPEAAKATVANMRKVYDRAILNAAKNAPKPEPKAVIIKNAQAKAPVATNMATIFAQCNGDPKAINAAIAKMAKGGSAE